MAAGATMTMCSGGLEQDIQEIGNVTCRLRIAEADRRATSAAAESLTHRLKAVRRIQLEVEQMA